MTKENKKEATPINVTDTEITGRDENSAVEYVTYIPPVDIYENDGVMKLLIDVPGASAEAISVHVEDQVLKISGDTDLVDYGRAVRYKREFPISKELNTTGIIAKIKNGVLEVILPKMDSAKVHKVKVSAE
ncbi:MAG: Hsp20/alpha crystallin family protein [Victivallaceae bacterium]|nr:Hsp20/alpha crystallin family protein [Victivallaceae bacterium]MDD4181475.1 Hsp20/alpha crystallin family protein [Victivallaceae bacterium]